MRRHFPWLALLSLLVATASHASTLVFSQPHDGSATTNKSAWYPPDGLDGDVYGWDNFSLASATAITEIHWRGGYQYHASGTGQAPIASFEVSIWASIAGNSQPDVVSGRLVRFTVTNANETAAGSFGGMAMFDYSYTLPSPFQAAAGAVYWVRIVAAQGAAPPSYAPDWGFATGTGGNGRHFTYTTGGNYQAPFNDLAFSLYTSGGATVTIGASASPAYAGSVSGAGAYPVGSVATLTALANGGHGFVNWTESGVQVSTNPVYSFTANANRTLVAHFDTTYSVTTYAYPSYGGVTTGDGTYLNGSTVTLTATPYHGFVFNSWSDGTTTPTYSFPAAYDVQITAFFDSAPLSVTYDFDGGPYQAGLPLSWTVNGLTANFTGGYSTQAVGTLGIAPAGFSGWCLFPSSVFQSDLGITFSERLTDFSVLYAVDELACDTSARMRVTAYADGVAVGTATAQALPGVYPSATLAIAPGARFDSVVVHWDAPGTLCQDYGPIFFADNVTVTRVDPLGAPGPRVPEALTLAAPAPNPFQGGTAIRFALPRACVVKLAVYDLTGRLVRALADGESPAGERTVTWNGADASGHRVNPGVYLLRLDAGGARATRTCVLMR